MAETGSVGLSDEYIYLEMLKAFQKTKIVGYVPEIVFEPDEETIREADRITQETIEKCDPEERAKDMYKPDTLGFFLCDKHSDCRLDGGIYLFIDRIREAAGSLNVPFHLLWASVFFHEFGHLLVHSISHTSGLNSFDRSNFEEPFCEMLSHYLLFLSYMENHDVDILGEEVRIEPASQRAERASLEERFVNIQRPYPYKWFYYLMKINTGSRADEDRWLMASKLLEGTLKKATDKAGSCSRYKIVFLNSKDSIQKLSNELLAKTLQIFDGLSVDVGG
ncbi:MAG TPA: hypothetical protein VMT42_01990 [candidate division Zixibacteria bacterium]|nr:hypothetical protein [candidate division Zixibacteria bacterium]